MRSSWRPVLGSALTGAVLHTLTVLWVWRTWGFFGRGNVIFWLDFPTALLYAQLEGGAFLLWSLLAGGLQWAVIGALVALLVGWAARQEG